MRNRILMELERGAGRRINVTGVERGRPSSLQLGDNTYLTFYKVHVLEWDLTCCLARYHSSNLME